MTHLGEAEMAAFLDGGLAQADRERVVAHIDVCDACRAELVDVGRAIDGRRAPPVKNGTPGTRRWWLPAALAAGIIAIFLVPRPAFRPGVASVRSRTTPIAEGERERHIGLIAPADDATVAAAQAVFTWHSVTADIYRFSLVSESADSVWAKETTDTTATLPATLSLTPATPYFWRVDAVANGIVAVTQVHRIHFAR